MFEWMKRRKKHPAAYVDFYIVLSGDQDVEINGVKGIALREVNREVYTKHKGLKYWIASRSLTGRKSDDTLRQLSITARIDIFDSIFFKKLRKFDGISDGNL